MGSFGIGGGTSTPIQISNWNAEQQQLFGQLAQMLQQGMSSYTPYTGSYSTPLTSEETSYLDWVADSGTRQAALESILSGQPSYDLSDEAAENLANARRDYYLREFKETTLPGVAEAYAGLRGTAAATAKSKASQDLATQIASERAELMYDVDVRKQELAESAAQRQAQYGLSSAATEAGIQSSAAEMASAQADEELAAQLQTWIDQQGFSNPYIQLMFQALGLTPYTIASEEESWNLGSGYTGTSSDIRLKENVKKVGEVEGINMYEFNFKDDPNKTKYKGVIAQEVVGIPGAVIKGDDGYLRVDYDKLPVKMEVVNG